MTKMTYESLAEKYADLLINAVSEKEHHMWVEGLIGSLGSSRRPAPRTVREKRMQHQFRSWFSTLKYAVKEIQQTGFESPWLQQPVVLVQGKPKTPLEMADYKRAPTSWSFDREKNE